MRIAKEYRARKLAQARAAELLCVTQPRVCALLPAVYLTWDLK